MYKIAKNLRPQWQFFLDKNKQTFYNKFGDIMNDIFNMIDEMIDDVDMIKLSILFNKKFEYIDKKY